MTRRLTWAGLLAGLIALVHAQNVGIGTSTPITRLHVAIGDLFLGEAGGANGFILHSRAWNGHDFLQITGRTGGSYDWSKGVAFVRSTGNVGIGTVAPATAALLELNATDKGFLPTRVALSAANIWSPLVGTSVDGMLVYNTATSGTGQNAVSPGYYYWRAGRWRRFSDNAYAGAIFGTLYTGTQNLTGGCNTFQYLNSYIQLPPGKWIVFSTQLLYPTNLGNTNGAVWVRTLFSDNTSCSSYSSDVIGSFYISGVLMHQAYYGLVTGQVIIYNPSTLTKTYYYCGCRELQNGYTGNLVNFSTTIWDENQLFAIPAD